MDDFDDFVADNLEQLLRTAYVITWDAGEAEDLVQECLFKVARRWPRVRKMAQQRAYTRRILVNLALDDSRSLWLRVRQCPRRRHIGRRHSVRRPFWGDWRRVQQPIADDRQQRGLVAVAAL
jgi:DNA-directed RNA polymerase specialized sigma24 family protein